jgi:NAD(P)-dependent dehydrogenase (short-subunit alcohol dehydrogenase family)
MKRVVITGSTRGIGLAMAVEFLRAGCRVMLSGRGDTLPEAAKAALAPYVENYAYFPCNVQQKKSLQALWNAFREMGRNRHLDQQCRTEHASPLCVGNGRTVVENLIRTNLTGMIFGSQIAAAEMKKQGHGAIYSMEGLGSNNMIQKKTILYGTTKRALTYFMKGIARELEGTGVIAGRLSPGMMLTDFITKTPDGETSALLLDKQFRKVFNTLADTPETVAAFLVPRMLHNTRNDVQIAWLTNGKAAWRFMTSGFRKDRLI